MATTPPTAGALDSAQRAWLKMMGAALDVKVAAGAPGPTGVAAAGPADAKQKTATKDAAAGPKISVAGKPLLIKGAKGNDVKDLQRLLNKHGAKLEDDGDFGKLTDEAVREFQKKNPPLAVDGKVGEKTWAALDKDPAPSPSPQDTKPRRVVVIVTDAATNNAVDKADVTIENQSEKTGNTGQATFSLPPGQYPFAVAAEGFDPFPFTGTIEVTAAEESTKHIELKGGGPVPGSKTALNVSPAAESDVGEKVMLVATVSMDDGTAAPAGVIRFEASLNESPGEKMLLAEVPLKDGAAIHAETTLPEGVHDIEATFVPMVVAAAPGAPGVIAAPGAPAKKGGSKSAPVRHKKKPKQPPLPPIPRKVFFIVTNSAKNIKIEKAIVKLDTLKDQTDRNGQVNFSIPPGKYRYSVSADGFEGDFNTIKVTTNTETTKEITLKSNAPGVTRIMMEVSPIGHSHEGEAIDLSAFVLPGNAAILPVGQVTITVESQKRRFGDVTTRQIATPVDNGYAKFKIPDLLKGIHRIQAKFTPKTPVKGVVEECETGVLVYEVEARKGRLIVEVTEKGIKLSGITVLVSPEDKLLLATFGEQLGKTREGIATFALPIGDYQVMVNEFRPDQIKVRIESGKDITVKFQEDPLRPRTRT